MNPNPLKSITNMITDPRTPNELKVNDPYLPKNLNIKIS
jgi:hypothetical protein